MRTVAAHEGGLLVALEEAEAVRFQRTAKILHQLHGESLLVLHFAAQQRQQGGGEAAFGDGAGHSGFGDGRDGVRCEGAEEVRFHFRLAGERRRRRSTLRQRLGSHRQPVCGG